MATSIPTTDATRRAVCVSIHDVAPSTWPACKRLLAAIEAVAPVPVTLLVAPAYHRKGDGGPSFHSALERRLARGDELALHGYFHLDEGPPSRGLRERLLRSWYTAGEGEFAALDFGAVLERLEAGQRWFTCHSWPLSGFVAPAWLMSAPTWAFLRTSGLRYTTTLRAFHTLDEGGCVSSQTLVYSVRSAWRRCASYGWNAYLARRLRGAPLLRLSLHPADVHHPRVIRHWQRLLGMALTDRTPMTKAAFCTELVTGHTLPTGPSEVERRSA